MSDIFESDSGTAGAIRRPEDPATEDQTTQHHPTQRHPTQGATTQGHTTEGTAPHPPAAEPAATEPSATEPAATEPSATEDTGPVRPNAWGPVAEGPITEPPSGWHRVNVGHLVMGLAFLCFVGAWALVQTDVVTGDEIRWLLPVPWLVAGAVGLISVAVSSARRHGVRR